uniref:Lysophosphatidic acid receptor 5 n=1 Tax=Jaculus jaculus TaxID=51337 RepID=A0A8C5K8T9_JACJA
LLHAGRMSADSSTNASFANSSVAPCPDYRGTHLLHMVVYSLVLAAGLPLNALALWVFLRVLRLHSVVSVYMCNLAASDLLFTLSLPLRLSYYALHHWPFPDLLCQASGAVFQMNMYGSCLFLMLINLDRYVAVVHPLRLRHLRRPRVARRLCLAVWALLLLLASLPLDFSDELWKSRLLPLVLLAETLGFLLPGAAVAYSSARVFRALARPGAPQSRRRRKTVRLLLASLAIFLLCFVPYNATLAVYGLLRGQLVPATRAAREQVRAVLMVMVLLASANCVLDPIVYYFSAEGFRNTLRSLGTPLRAGTAAAANGSRGTEAPSEAVPASGHDATGQDLSPAPTPGTPFLPCSLDSAL